MYNQSLQNTHGYLEDIKKEMMDTKDIDLKFHFIFLLDDSYSMQSYYQLVQEAFTKFLEIAVEAYSSSSTMSLSVFNDKSVI